MLCWFRKCGLIRQIEIAEMAFMLFDDSFGSAGGTRNVSAGFIMLGLFRSGYRQWVVTEFRARKNLESFQHKLVYVTAISLIGTSG